MERIIPDGSQTNRTRMISEAEQSRRIASRHDACRDWEARVSIVTFPEKPVGDPYAGLETALGSLVMSRIITAERAYWAVEIEKPPV